MRTNLEMMKNTLTEEHHWKQSNRHLTAVAEFAIIPTLFVILFILVVLLN